MKAIMIMFDSLRKDLLSLNGGPIATPNFERLAKHTIQFDRCYAGSLPCMPARRELQTGRYNFLHRSWGPMEPFDDSLPRILSQNGIHTHLATDHYHYIQDGGATYTGRFDSWECYRGQESDTWVGEVKKHEGFAPCLMSADKCAPTMVNIRKKVGWQNMANRTLMQKAEDYPSFKTFHNGIDFLKYNEGEDNWFLQIETFDPHEPFQSPESWQLQYMDPDSLSSPDWPPYAVVTEDEEAIEKMRAKYFASTAFCDHLLGEVLDEMDRQDLWKDTMLIVNTDHGFLLAEHDRWGKGTSRNYSELVNNPFFFYDPRTGRKDEKSDVLCQTIDVVPTVLEYFGIARTEDMTGIPLALALQKQEEPHDVVIFGYLGGHLGITDGRYVLLRDIQDKSTQLYEYTLMPTHMKDFFSAEELKSAELVPPFGFTKGMPLLKTKAKINPRYLIALDKGDELYDLEKDPKQTSPYRDSEIENRLLKGAARLFKKHEAPEELYRYFGLEKE